MPSRSYYVLDVFTDRILAGNPLAVVTESEGLDDARMQAIAREFNLSETVFVSPPRDPANRAALRIFTPGRELPFAGHPTVGTAVLLASLDGLTGEKNFVLEEKVGPVSCTVRAGNVPHATFRLPALPEEAGLPPRDGELARVLSLDEDDIGCGAHRPTRWGAPNPFTFVPVGGLDTIARCRVDLEAAGEVLAHLGPANLYVYTLETETPEARLHARMFAPGMGIVEDPATGSAAAAFTGVWQAFEFPPDGTTSILIEQGFEMGRPSLIELGIEVEGGKLTGGTIGGSAIIVAEGKLFA